jgi:F420-dependent oxidoreductase-like protein
VRLGLQVVRFDWPESPQNTGVKLAEIARAAEAAGFYSLWVMDHYFQIAPRLGPPEAPMLEGYSALHFLAAHTTRLKLGTLVSGVIYREPAFLVKQASTLDVLSGGRAYFGIGAAWYEAEAVGLGFRFPTVRERFERLEEALQIAKQMWSGDRAPFHGKHYRLEQPINSPQPLSRPHPPILIGGLGERKTLRMVAQYGDACNLFARIGEHELARKLDVLRGHCDRVGRNYDEIEKTCLATLNLAPGESSPADVIRSCRNLARLGIQHVIFTVIDVHTIEPIERIGREVRPEVTGL